MITKTFRSDLNPPNTPAPGPKVQSLLGTTALGHQRRQVSAEHPEGPPSCSNDPGVLGVPGRTPAALHPALPNPEGRFRGSRAGLGRGAPSRTGAPDLEQRRPRLWGCSLNLAASAFVPARLIRTEKPPGTTSSGTICPRGGATAVASAELVRLCTREDGGGSSGHSGAAPRSRPSAERWVACRGRCRTGRAETRGRFPGENKAKRIFLQPLPCIPGGLVAWQQRVSMGDQSDSTAARALALHATHPGSIP